jgi:hypothetical protein
MSTRPTGLWVAHRSLLAAFVVFGLPWGNRVRAEEAPRTVSLDEALKAAALLPDLKAAEAALGWRSGWRACPRRSGPGRW